MHRRAVRFGVVVLLLVGGVGAGVATRELHRQMNALADSSRDVAIRLQAMTTTLADVAAAQSAYLMPGQSLPSAAARVASLTQQLDADAAVIRPKLRSVDAAAQLEALASGAAAFQAIDQRVRQRLADDPAAAAAVISGDAAKALAGMRMTLVDLASAEASASGAERAALQSQVWTVLGPLAVAWVLGLVVLARAPKAAVPAMTALPAPPTPLPGASPMAEEAASAPAPAGSSIDLAAAADLGTAIARMASAAALPDILARAASVIDASGIILWMGAGDELFAAGSYGYDPKVIGRLGPIHRSADNATAASWRTGEVRTVSGDMMTNGAIVAPMFGPETCIGVLAAEIRHGGEGDAATRAMTSIIAAQLATVVAAWPGASELPQSSQATQATQAT